MTGRIVNQRIPAHRLNGANLRAGRKTNKGLDPSLRGPLHILPRLAGAGDTVADRTANARIAVNSQVGSFSRALPEQQPR